MDMDNYRWMRRLVRIAVAAISAAGACRCSRECAVGAGGQPGVFAGAVGGDGPQHHRGVPGRRSAGGLPARRPARPR